MEFMPLYLGIDAGGTKTDCAVSNGAELLGQATGEANGGDSSDGTFTIELLF